MDMPAGPSRNLSRVMSAELKGASVSTQAGTLGPSVPTGLEVTVTHSPYVVTDPLGKHPILVKDPLSDVTRKERRAFLGVSILAIAVQKANLIPSEITAFGVHIDAIRHEALIRLLTAVVLYFLMVFIAYALSDFIAWRIAFWESIQARALEREKEEHHTEPPLSEEAQLCEDKRMIWSGWSIYSSALRAFLDFFFPLLVGSIAIAVLLSWV